MGSTSKTYGVLAEFETAGQLYAACESVRDAGFTKWDAYSPFPVHGLDKAMGLKRSPLPWFVLVMAFTGAGFALALQGWTAAVDYPIMIAGKPYFSLEAFIPVTFELTILFASFGALFTLLGLCRLPTYYHPVFNSERFKAVTNDKFFVAIEAVDPEYDERKVSKLFKRLGATHVETLED